MTLIFEGHSRRKIAERPTISATTAEWYRANIRQKLRPGDRVDLIRYSILAGLAEL